MSAPHDDVVITGLAATSPLGGTARSTWQALLARASAAVPLTEAWAADLPVRIAAPAAVEPGPLLDRIQARRTDRAAQFALVALREAWADAGFTGTAGAPGRRWRSASPWWSAAVSAGSAPCCPPMT